MNVLSRFPAEGARNVLPDTTVEFTLVADTSEAIDVSTIAVLVNDNFAIKEGDIIPTFSGIGTTITPSGDDFEIVIVPENLFQLSDNVKVQIQAKNSAGKYFNNTYVFFIAKEEPELVFSSPSNDATISLPQMIYLHFQDIIDGVNLLTLNLDINTAPYIVDGVVQQNINGFLTEVIEDGDSLIVKIDPSEYFKQGSYLLEYSVEDSIGNVLIGELKFNVYLSEIILPDFFPQTGFLGYFQGITGVNDNGNGTSLNISVSQPTMRSYKSEVFSLIYQNEERLKVFDNNPRYIFRYDILSADIEGFAPGVAMSFAARAMEVYKDIIDVNGMDEISDGVWLFPEVTQVSSLVTMSDLIINVDSTDGYPSSGLLKIGSEILRYSSKSVDQFFISTNGRGVADSVIGIYNDGEPVSMFSGCQDSNGIIVMATPTYGDGYLSGREINEIGVNVTDYGDSDQMFFQGYDYCGYHQALPFNTLNGKDDCGTYLGGEFNGLRGFNLYDQMLNNEEVLLENTGEPVILLKRVWNGEKCSCMNLRKLHPRQRTCSDCFGTGFLGGFTQYNNLRRQDRRILVSISDSPEDLKLGEKEHLAQEFEPSAWTLAQPAIRDRDLLIRFDFTEDREFIYEVLDVGREKLIFRKYGRQTLKLKRLDVTDIAYSIPYSRNF